MNGKKTKAPGEKLVKSLSLENKWLITSGGGLALVGLGLCLFSEASNLKHMGADTASWVFAGTLSLIVINGGLAIFGQGIVFKSQLDHKQKMKDFRKNQPKKKKKMPAEFNRNWRESDGPLP